MGGGNQARPHSLRDGGNSRRCGTRGDGTGCEQAADQDQVHHARRSRRGCAVKLNEIREMTVEDLKVREGELVESIFKGRFRKSLGEIDAAKQIRAQKKELARVKTVLRERETGLER